MGAAVRPVQGPENVCSGMLWYFGGKGDGTAHHQGGQAQSKDLITLRY